MKTRFRHLALVTLGLCVIWTLCSSGLTASARAPAAGKPPTATATPTTAPTNTPTPLPPHAHYVDCSAATNGDGSQANPWNSLASPNAHTFGPGDSLLFKRGVTCNGGFVATGSGSAAYPITIADYGTGALPILDGGTTNTHTILLNNVEYYELSNLTIRGGSLWGVRINATTTGLTLNHFYVTNLDISAVNHTATARNDSGLLGIYPDVAGSIMNDILVDGVTTHDTTAGAGITIGGGRDYPCSGSCTYPGGTGIIVRNSLSHDVGGDGIVIWALQNGLIETSVAYNTGECTTCSGSTPVSIWTWDTNGATVQNTESYSAHTWNSDGGGYDIDGDNLDNIYQYNYGHDSDGQCIAILDFDATVATTNSVVRYNICAANAVAGSNSGEILPWVWSSGTLNGVQVYNNTIYANSTQSSFAVIHDGAGNGGTRVTYSGSIPNFYKNNLIYSTNAAMTFISTTPTLDYNLWYSTTGSYSFKRGSSTYTSFSAWQGGSGQDAHGLSSNPNLNGVGYHAAGLPTLANGYYTLQTNSPALSTGTDACATSCIGSTMGAQDFFGNTLASTHNIGAYEGSGQ